ncbi:MAG: cytidine deaminase [Flavobacteriales bacterium]|nr:cytidine deaminase [Flavobacteriales bacterium]
MPIDRFLQIPEEQLQPEEAGLLTKAREAALSAYAPYSKFSVGAALLLENGEVITASNQENAAFPSGLCAERVALFYAGSRFPGVALKSIAVAVLSDKKEKDRVYAPCGACRQVMAETENRQNQPFKIIFEGPGNLITYCNGIEPLLPFSFKLSTE